MEFELEKLAYIEFQRKMYLKVSGITYQVSCYNLVLA